MAGVSTIELDPKYLEMCRGGIRNIRQISVEQRTLNSLIERDIGNSKIDILQIDVEGGELKVLKGLDLIKYSPKVVLVEDIFGDQQLYDYLVNNGYKLDKPISYNKYYIPNQ